MDTPDKAGDLADSQLADSINREWLLNSARSSHVSTEPRNYQLDFSTNSTNSNNINSLTQRTTSNNLYGTINGTHGIRDEIGPTHDRPVETSSLMRHYVATKKKTKRLLEDRSSPTISPSSFNLVQQDQAPPNYTINNHIYDNISFAESPILRSLSHKSYGKDFERSCSHEDELPGKENHYKTEKLLPFADKFRYFLACYLLLGITLAIYSRNALSLASVGMVANNAMNKELADILSTSEPHIGDNNQLEGACPITRRVNHMGLQGLNQSQPQKLIVTSQSELLHNLKLSIDQRLSRGDLVDWSPGQQGLIFAAGSLGNLLIGIPLTRMGEIYGPKWIIFVASLGATFQAALMPIISPCSIILIIPFQIIFNGLTYGADCVAYTLFAYWLTPTEMAFFVSCLLICFQLGSILSSFATAKILSENLPWSWCFYSPAILCGLWTLIWVLVGASDPSKSRLISRREMSYLLRNNKIAHTLRESEAGDAFHNEASVDGNGRQTSTNQSHSISWLKLGRDPNIWAICAVKFTLRWYFSTYLSLMPTYLSSVAQMSVGTIGKMSVIQSIIGTILGILMGFLTKSLIVKRPFGMSLAATRKFFQSIVNFGLVISLVVLIIYDCDQWIIIITLTLGGICINFYVAAAVQLPLDLSPNHCGLIASITNTLAFGQALGAPISGLILNEGPKDRTRWRLVWLVTIVLNLFSGIIFIYLVDSKPRDYSKGDSSSVVSNGNDEEHRSASRDASRSRKIKL